MFPAKKRLNVPACNGFVSNTQQLSGDYPLSQLRHGNLVTKHGLFSSFRIISHIFYFMKVRTNYLHIFMWHNFPLKPELHLKDAGYRHKKLPRTCVCKKILMISFSMLFKDLTAFWSDEVYIFSRVVQPPASLPVCQGIHGVQQLNIAAVSWGKEMHHWKKTQFTARAGKASAHSSKDHLCSLLFVNL